MERGVRILVLSFYYRPDLSAGSFRVTALVDRLRTKAPAGSHIDVVTTLPNRYRSFTADAARHEERDGVTVHRVALPKHASGFVDQSRAFLAFARGAASFTSGKQYDVVFATSSRLMTAVLGAWIARRARARLYLDIRDIFADTIKDVFRGAPGRVAEQVFSRLERYAVRRATRLNVVSAGFLEYFNRRYPGITASCFTNGIDDEFLAAAPKSRSPSPRIAESGLATVLYAGNVGEGQGLDVIVPKLAKALGDRVRFRIVGDGGRINALRAAIAAEGVTNVELLPPVSRADLVAAYRDADVLFLHLNDYPAFEKVLPSKIFEYAAMGKPVWAGIGGYSATFVRTNVTNAGVFSPCDVAGGVRAFDALVMEDAPRTEFLARFSRGTITELLVDDLLATAKA